MIDNKKVTIVSESTIDGERVAAFAAVLDLVNREVTTTARYVNGVTYRDHKDFVRSDMEQFERLAYDIQDMMQRVESDDSEEQIGEDVVE